MKKLRKKKVKIGTGRIRTWALSLEGTELKQKTIGTVAMLWLLFFKDIFAHNSMMKLKLKILVSVNLSFLMFYLLVFECLWHVLELNII